MKSPLRSATSPQWLGVALNDLDAVLLDHAHCEKKAAATAMALVSQYPDHTELVKRMCKLAQEELRHFAQVHAIILQRGRVLERDMGDPYAKRLMALARADHEARRTDRLLICSLIEARSAERLGLLADGLTDPELKKFYQQLATAEAGHFRLFCDLAQMYDKSAPRRLRMLATQEAQIVADLPVEPRIH